MAKIYVDKYGNETTEGPQEGVIGAATGTHSSAGLNSFQTNFNAKSVGSMDQIPQMPPPNPPTPGGPGHWQRNDNGQWEQVQTPAEMPQPGGPGLMSAIAQAQQPPMTVQQMHARAMAGLPPLGVNPPQPQKLPFPWASWIQPWSGPIGS